MYSRVEHTITADPDLEPEYDPTRLTTPSIFIEWSKNLWLNSFANLVWVSKNYPTPTLWPFLEQ